MKKHFPSPACFIAILFILGPVFLFSSRSASASGHLPIVFREETGKAPFEDVTYVAENPFPEGTELLQVDFLGIRQGDCVLISSCGETMLLDGGETIRFDFISKYFEEHGIDHLDYMFLTHAHDDHLEIQQRLIKRGFPVGRFFSPYDEKDTWTLWKPLLKLLKEKEIPYEKVSTGDVIHVGAAELIVFRNTSEGLSMNDQSAAVMLRYKGASVLLTADIAGLTQHWLCDNYGDALDADIMKSPHHGITTNVAEFLDRVSPGLVVITNDKSNVEKYDAQLDRLNIPRYFISSTVHLQTDGAMWYVWTDRK
ncbi:MAG: MBL fold metallo-hydrolase [Clostridia bacterium]|nr:MBL fold metallo-hydrolase [Clostridia bacterium]